MLMCASIRLTPTLPGQAIRFGPSKMKTGKPKTGKEAVTWAETDESDNGIFAKVPLNAGERMLYDAATAIKFPYHIYSRMWELQNLTDNEYLEDVLEWIDRYVE